MDIRGARQSDYSILISRAWKRPNADLYPFALRQPIPAFGLPLKKEDAEPVIELNTLLNFVYQQARLELLVDYEQPLKPALSSEDREWARTIMASTGVDFHGGG